MFYVYSFVPYTGKCICRTMTVITYVNINLRKTTLSTRDHIGNANTRKYLKKSKMYLTKCLSIVPFLSIFFLL